MARLYAGALQRMGTTVTLRLDLPDEFEAVDDGEATVVPALTGVLLHRYNPDATARDSDAVAAALARSLPEGLSVADYCTDATWGNTKVSENPVPVYRSTSLSEAQIKKLNIIAGTLVTADLKDLTASHSPDTDTRSWLDRNGF